MARHVIRDPQSRPLSSYEFVDHSKFPHESGFKGLILDPGRITKTLTPDSIDLSVPIVKFSPAKEEPKIRLNIPVMSAAMQAVSGHRMAVGLARLGGLGVIYQSQTPDQEAEQVKTAKRHKGAFIEPETAAPDTPLSRVAERMKATGYGKFFVTEGGKQHGKFLGIITRNDFDVNRHAGQTVENRMQPAEKIEKIYDDEIGYNVKEANELLLQSHQDTLPVLFRDGRLRDALFRKDIEHHREYKNELIDSNKRLVVAAAVNTHDYQTRVPKVVEAGADIIVIDTSHGWSEFVKETTQYIKSKYPHVPVIGGNIVNEGGFAFLVEECGVDAVKVGMGPGSICITPLQKGVASGQDRAIERVVNARNEYFQKTGIYVPVIADGSMRTVRDINVALAFGADAVMLGYMLAGADESPTEIVYRATGPKKPYWGEGSERAQAWRTQRGYSLKFEEGVEGWVDYVGPIDVYMGKLVAQMREGIRGTGCRSIAELHANAVISTISEKDANAEKALQQ